MPTGTDKPMVLSEDGLPYPEDGSPFQKRRHGRDRAGTD
ncbi:hypothetical protein EV561_14924, partial [Rhizobium sp. BK376]